MSLHRVFRYSYPELHRALNKTNSLKSGLISSGQKFSTQSSQKCTKDQTTDLAERKDFEIRLDVDDFSPNEITVKAVDDYIIIEGKQKKKDKYNFSSRHFVRSYSLPKNCDLLKVESTLSSDGRLTIKAPVLKETPSNNERKIEIREVGPEKH